MLIRRATADDLPTLEYLLRQSPTSAQWSSSQLADLVSGATSSRLALVAAERQIICGFLAAHAIAGEWELENIVVGEGFRQQGIGLALLRALLKEAAAGHATEIFLEVRESNLAARRLYEKIGFRESGRRPRYYPDPVEDAILYRLDFR